MKFVHLWSPHISCRKHGKSIPRCVSPGSWTQSSRILKYSSCRPERGDAVVSRLFSRLKIDIGQFGETDEKLMSCRNDCRIFIDIHRNSSQFITDCSSFCEILMRAPMRAVIRMTRLMGTRASWPKSRMTVPRLRGSSWDPPDQAELVHLILAHGKYGGIWWNMVEYGGNITTIVSIAPNHSSHIQSFATKSSLHYPRLGRRPASLSCCCSSLIHSCASGRRGAIWPEPLKKAPKAEGLMPGIVTKITHIFLGVYRCISQVYPKYSSAICPPSLTLKEVAKFHDFRGREAHGPDGQLEDQ